MSFHVGWFFGRKKDRAARLAANGKRVTGMVTELPAGVKFALTLAVCAVVGAGSLWGMWALFNAYYFRSQALFTLRDFRKNVTITTGKTLTPDLVCEILGLREGMNQFSIPIARKRQELLEQAPQIRELSIVRRLPGKLDITIVEREPIARVGGGARDGRVVDDDGVVFIRYSGTGAMPLIKGANVFDEVKPGDPLKGNEMAAVRLVKDMLRPECRLRLLDVDVAKPDYLLLRFSDGRQAKFAWKGMSDDGRDTTAQMRRQFDNLQNAMESEIGKRRLKWEAIIPGKVFAEAFGT